MLENAIEDWATGICRPLYQLVDDCADDETLERFIKARKAGDAGLANQILASSRPSPPVDQTPDLSPELDGVLGQLRVAALKPVVNQLDVRRLHQYIYDVWHLSEHVVRANKDESFWSAEPVIEAVAEVVMRFALERSVDGSGTTP